MHSWPHMSIDKLIKAKNYPVYLGLQAWIRVSLKKYNFIENQKKECKSNEIRLDVFKKGDFDTKHPK